MNFSLDMNLGIALPYSRLKKKDSPQLYKNICYQTWRRVRGGSALYLVPLQLDLFPHRIPPVNPDVTDTERDRRFQSQWLRSIVAYLEFRTGDGWRRLTDPNQRWNHDRLDYLDAIRIINGFRGFPEFLPAPLPNRELNPKKLIPGRRRRQDRVA